ncbi:MAG: alpha/beta fold hydrolase [PVC group bacterium]
MLIVIEILIAGFLALNLLAYNHARTMMHYSGGGPRTPSPERLTLGRKLDVLFFGINAPRPRVTGVSSSLEAGCQSLRIPCPGGIELGAWYCPVQNGSALCILFHGYAGEKSSLLPEARAFQELGLSILLVDFRGSGESSESYTTFGFDEAEDVAAAVRYARENLSFSRLILFGRSMGSAAILRAVHSLGIKPDAVIVESVFDTMLNTVRNRFDSMGIPSFPGAELIVYWGGKQNGFSGFEHNPVDYAEAVSCPILFLHGSDDPRARVAEGRRVFAAVPAPKFFKEFPGTGHDPYLSRFPEDWKGTVGRFLQGNIEDQRL